MGNKVLEAAWVLVFFVAAATAYAFFQVPYVAMPAEITSSYDERTRLMTWRVAILAFTIMLAGATAPVIRDAVGGRDGYRVEHLAAHRAMPCRNIDLTGIIKQINVVLCQQQSSATRTDVATRLRGR